MIKKTLILHLFILVYSIGYGQNGLALRSSWAKSYADISVPFLDKPVSAKVPSQHSYTYSPSQVWRIETLYKFQKGLMIRLGAGYQKHSFSVIHYYDFDQKPTVPMQTDHYLEQMPVEAGIGWDMQAFENMRIFCHASYLYYVGLKEKESTEYQDKSFSQSAYFKHSGPRHGLLAGLGIVLHLNDQLGLSSELDFLSSPTYIQYRYLGTTHTAGLSGIMFNLGLEFRIFEQKKEE